MFLFFKSNNNVYKNNFLILKIYTISNFFAELIDVLMQVDPFQTLCNALWTLSGSKKVCIKVLNVVYICI